MRRFRLSYTLLAVAALLSLACSGGRGETGASTAGGTPPAVTKTTTAPTTVPAGQPMTLTEDLFGNRTVVVISVANVGPVKPANQFDKPVRGQYLGADVTVQVQDGKFSISSGLFKLVTAAGVAYDPTLILGRPDLSSNDLTPGQKTSGSITFDIPPGAEKQARVALKSWLAEGDAGYWQLP